jgi:hypothetical protein
MRTVNTLLLFALLFFAYRRADSKLAKVAVGCGALMIPASIYNWIYGLPPWTLNMPAHINVLTSMAMGGLILGCLLGSIALIRDGLKGE